MTRAEIIDLVTSIERLRAEMDAGTLSTSSAMVYRLEGALTVLQAVLGQLEVPEAWTAGEA